MTATGPRTLDPDNLDPLARWLAGAVGARRVEIARAELLSGGAVQENWRIDVVVDGGPRAGAHSLVLRTDAVARLPMSLDRHREFACIRAAHEAGVMVAEPIAECADRSVIGAPFAVQRLIRGMAQGRRIVRDPHLARHGPDLARQLGGQLARIHAIRPPREDLAFLPLPEPDAASAGVAELRRALDKASVARPALEYVLVWLLANRPAPRPTVLVHGDFRTGNYMMEHSQLTGILDWEFCHWGDPREDLGWFCARCWRFGNDTLAAGGIAGREDLLVGYNAASDAPIASNELAYWEIFAAARWAVIALLQGQRFLTGGERSLELALTGLMPAEMEFDALDAIAIFEAGGQAP
ncbi:MAG: phosphotransferase family protein [Hyphomicrobiaceae bacterium]